MHVLEIHGYRYEYRLKPRHEVKADGEWITLDQFVEWLIVNSEYEQLEDLTAIIT